MNGMNGASHAVKATAIEDLGSIQQQTSSDYIYISTTHFIMRSPSGKRG